MQDLPAQYDLAKRNFRNSMFVWCLALLILSAWIWRPFLLPVHPRTDQVSTFGPMSAPLGYAILLGSVVIIVMTILFELSKLAGQLKRSRRIWWLWGVIVIVISVLSTIMSYQVTLYYVERGMLN